MNYYTLAQLKNYVLKIYPKNSHENFLIRKKFLVPKLYQLLNKNAQLDHLGFNERGMLCISETYAQKIFNELNINFKLPDKLKDTTIFNFLPTLSQHLFFDTLNKKRNFSIVKKNTGPKMPSFSYVEKIHSILNSDAKLLFLDFEAYEKNNDKTTEVGFLSIQSGNIKDIGHYVVEEHKMLKNGEFVTDNQSNFQYGTSEFIPLNEVIKKVDLLLKNHDFIIFHGAQGDLKTISAMGIEIEHKKVLDSSILTRLLDHQKNTIGIERFQKTYGTSFKEPVFLHNAGNDSVYTYDLLINCINKISKLHPEKALKPVHNSLPKDNKKNIKFYSF